MYDIYHYNHISLMIATIDSSINLIAIYGCRYELLRSPGQGLPAPMVPTFQGKEMVVLTVEKHEQHCEISRVNIHMSDMITV